MTGRLSALTKRPEAHTAISPTLAENGVLSAPHGLVVKLSPGLVPGWFGSLSDSCPHESAQIGGVQCIPALPECCIDGLAL